MKKTAFLIAALTFSFLAAAQTIPVNPKFGSISDAEIDMTVYSPDTSAVAVMLYREYTMDLVISEVSGVIVKDITVHERIKVLKEEGKRFGDFSFLYLNSNSTKEAYSGVKVETFNRENGKVVRTKMSKKFDFDEKYAEDVRRRSFSAENVKVGSVIEVAYKFSSPRYYAIDDIDIQLTIPVNQTHIEVGYAEYFGVNRTQRGSVPTRYRKDNRIANLPGATSYEVNLDVFDAVDVPALPAESHSFCPDQYRGAITYDLSSVVIPGVVFESISMKWPDVDKAISESDIFRVCKGKFRDAKELEAALTGVEGDEARIAAVRNYVVGKVKWDEESQLVPDDAREILKRGSGSDADINALTASALNTLGYTAEPVMIRRRTSGMLIDHHISLRSFDTFILRVTAPGGQGPWYLDAARDEGYLNVLNPLFLVEKARVIPFNGSGEWVDLTNLTRSHVSELVKMRMEPDGTLTGSAQIVANQEDSYLVKAHYNSFDTEDAFLEDIESDEHIEITAFEIKKEYGPTAEISYSFEKENEAGSLLYIQPVLSSFHSSSDFRKEERKLPVDFPYPESITYSFSLEIPEGYVVEELPEKVGLTFPSLEGRIQFATQQVGNIVSVLYRASLGKMLVLPEEYADLRLFWETAIGVEKSTIVLKKQ
ncbi:MAG: DUF3857 domain-containing protein [Bacteroidales bacterium]|nr:DUF3857 domain-containing protein [Bacteroidales bacterium]